MATWFLLWFVSGILFYTFNIGTSSSNGNKEARLRNSTLRYIPKPNTNAQNCSTSAMDPSLNNNPTYTAFSDKKMRELFGGSLTDRMDLDEFRQHVTQALIGAKHPLDENEIWKLFSACDENKDGFLDEKEQHNAYERWLRRVVAPVNALVIIDVQNDFVNGSLAVRDAPSIIPVINSLLKKFKFDVVAYTFDHHPANHISFYTNVHKYTLDPTSPIQDPKEAGKFKKVIFKTRFGPVEQRLWPPHCIQGSKGNELYPDLYVRPDNFFIYKGMEPDIESYTAFGEPTKGAATCLDQNLRTRNVTEIYTVGLAADVCVAFTGRDALQLGYGVAMVEDGMRAVNSEDMRNTKLMIGSLGGHYCTSEDVFEGQGFTIDDRVRSLRHALKKV